MNKELFSYVLFKYNVYDSDYYFVSRDELPNSGFSSLYYIPGFTAEELQRTGPKGYKGPVWSEWLWIDEDTEQGALQTERRLRDLGLEFNVYTTGNRGKHFQVKRECEPSSDLPLQDKLYVKAISTTADLTIYTHLHLFRIDGTRHEKTGRYKEYMHGFQGLSIRHDPLPDMEDFVNKNADGPVLSIFLQQHIMNMTTPIDDGGRNNRLISLGVGLLHLGEPIEFVERWLYHTNLLFNPPVSEPEFKNITDWLRQEMSDV